MSKHTQGPWSGGKECINAPNGRLIAEVMFYNSPDRKEMTNEEFEANSNLLAAAPDMLNALLRCVSALRANGAPNCEAVKEANNIIYNILGESKRATNSIESTQANRVEPIEWVDCEYCERRIPKSDISCEWCGTTNGKRAR